MGLFDKGIPAGIQGMLVQILKQAAPELAQNIDQFTDVVRHFKDQLDRIEQRQDRIEKLLISMEQQHGEREFGNGDGKNAIPG